MTSFATREELTTLVAMLRYRRPAGSKTEDRFIKVFLSPLGLEMDSYGNLYKRIGDAPVLWSSHTDTVHRDGGEQRLVISGDKISAGGASNCLGADCTAGVWLMSEMIRAGVPGLYVFHREEECGGGGSNYIAKDTPGLLAGIEYAIAFDRYGYESVITHQFGQRCCSDVFAKSLADALGLGMRLDDGGSFTDTANYTDLIGECTNISVGYFNQHTKSEYQDIAFLLRLRDALLAFDWRDLVSSRKPGELDPADSHFRRYGRKAFDYTQWMDDLWDQGATPVPTRGRTILSVLKDYPDEIADWLEEQGLTADDLMHEVYQRGGAA